MFQRQIKEVKINGCLLILVSFLCISACSDEITKPIGLGVFTQSVANDCDAINVNADQQKYNRVDLLDELAFCYGFVVDGQLSAKHIELNLKQQPLHNVLASMFMGVNYSLKYESNNQGESILKKIYITDYSFTLSESAEAYEQLDEVNPGQAAKKNTTIVASNRTASMNAKGLINQTVDSELFDAFNSEWYIRQTIDEQDEFLQSLDVNAATTRWMKEKINDDIEDIEGRIAILHRIEIENNSAAKSIALDALKSSSNELVSLALDIIYSWNDSSLAPHLLYIAVNHSDDEIRKEAQELYDYFSEYL